MKPPYKIQSMHEIKLVPLNNFSVISTFSGCGGSTLGYKMAGFKVLWANEFIPAAQETYNANHEATILDKRDIREITAKSILDAIHMQPGELDLLDGSPPCASFSTAGKREAGWGKVNKYSDGAQRTDDLFYELIRLVRGIQPKVFVAENVSGLVKGTAKGYFLEILAAMKASGYRVACRVLDAQWLGVPQKRQRTIFIGVREDLRPEPAHPKPLPYRYSVRDALPEVTAFDMGKGFGQYEKLQSTSGPYQAVGCSPASGNGLATAVYFGEVKRKFTIAELKRICGFPDDFILTGSYAQQWERLGRAVPPIMMFHIAKTVRDEILCKV